MWETLPCISMEARNLEACWYHNGRLREQNPNATQNPFRLINR